jgi:5-methylcytosine-specific restriction endonuclease McrA
VKEIDVQKRTCAWPDCGETVARKWCRTHAAIVWPYGSDSKTKTCSVEGCMRFVRAHGLCNSHYNAARRATQPEDRSVRNGDPARRAEALRTKSLFRKSVITAPDAESINLAALGARDGWTCGICGLPVDKTVQYPARMAPTIDHVTPISHGGRHRWDNVQLSHFACNMAKGDAVA